MELLDRSWHGNTVHAYLFAVVAAIATTVFVRVAVGFVRRRVARLSGRTRTGVDDVVVDILGATKLPLIIVAAAWGASNGLVRSPAVASILDRVAAIALALQVGIWAGAAIRGATRRIRDRKLANGETASVGVIAMVGLLASIVAWAIVLLVILENVGIDITALVAGLGIGGIAIALAAQNILGDLFASISIIFDKPFAIGDSIAVDNLSGTVDQIGLKTTRVRSTGGEELVLPNGELLKSRIRNFRRMVERRVAVVVAIGYETPIADVEAVPALLRGIVESEANVRFDRAHLRTLADWALQFELVYFITTPDYHAYMDAQQAINLRILRGLAERGVSFARPPVADPLTTTRTGPNAAALLAPTTT